MSENVKFLSKAVKKGETQGFVPSIEIVNCGRNILREWTVPMRCQSFWHLYWNRQYGAKIILPSRVVPMSPDVFYLLPPYLVFATECDSDFEHYFLDFKVNHEVFCSLKKELITIESDKYAESLSDCMKNGLSALKAGALILTLLSEISQEQFVRQKVRHIDSRIIAALSLITESIQKGDFKNLNNQDFSRRIGMSKDNFQHLFAKELNISPGHYILNRRLDLARILLRDSNQNIEEVALNTGFANRYQFTKSFTAFFHVAPGQFRQRCRSSDASLSLSDH